MFRSVRFGIFVLLSLVITGLAALPAAAQPASYAGAAPVAEAALAPAAATVTYIVLPGDTLARIAARFGTTVSAILAANPQITNPNRIYVGQRLQIPVAGGPSAERISFAAGTTNAARIGSLAAGASRRYVFGAQGGQVAMIDASTAGNNAWLAVYGANGRVVLSRAAGIASMRAPLPTTQDYVIEVYTTAAAGPASYTLNLSIPERVRFAPGTVSTSVTGYVPAFGTHTYVLRASAGQLMTVDVQSFGGLILVVYGNDGSVLQGDDVPSSSFSGRLPLTEDYYLDVRMVGQAAARYQLNVRITN